MSAIERIVGHILAAILIALVILSFLYSAFTLLFRDGRGLGLYGSRGEAYMAE